MKNILVMFGGDSVESDVSVISATIALSGLNMNKYKAFPIYIKNGKFYLVKNSVAADISTYTSIDEKSMREVFISDGELYQRGKFKNKLLAFIDCALLVTHGGVGENGGLQGFLEMNNIPYTSSGIMSSSICMDKALTHKLTKAFDIPTVNYFVVNNKTSAMEVKDIFEKLDKSVVVKPNSLGSSIGIRVCNSERELFSAIAEGFRYDEKVIIEKRVDNLAEINIALFEDMDSLVVSDSEIVSCSEFFDFESKYIKGGEKEDIEVPMSISDNVKKWSIEIYRNLALSGVVRIDYLYDRESEKIYLNEINTIPGSLAYYLFDKLGYDITDITDKMIETSISKFNKSKLLVKSFSSSILTIRENNSSKLLQKTHK